MGWGQIAGSIASNIAEPIAGLVGIDMDRSAQNKRQDKDLRQQMEQFNRQLEFSAEQANLDRNMQRVFAQNSLSWQAEDMRRAGLHPSLMFPGGGSTAIPAGQSVGSPSYHHSSGTGSYADVFSKMGANLGNTIRRLMNPEQKALDKLTKQGMQLDNEYKWLRNLGAAKDIWEPKEPSQPGDPSIVNADRFGVPNKAASNKVGYQYEVNRYPVASSIGKKAGMSAMFEFSITPQGWAIPHLTAEKAEALESDWLGLAQYIVNRVNLWSEGAGRPWIEMLPGRFGAKAKMIRENARNAVKPDTKAPAGYYWKYHWKAGLWKLHKDSNLHRQDNRH